MSYLTKTMADLQAVYDGDSNNILFLVLGTKIRCLILAPDGIIEAWQVTP